MYKKKTDSCKNILNSIKWEIINVDWTYKQFNNVKSNVDTNILQSMKNNKIANNVFIRYCHDDDDNEHHEDTDDEDDDEIKHDEDNDNKFSNDKPLTVAIDLVLTYQVFACGANFILDHSLVPNEGHATFIPALAAAIEALLKASKNFIDKLQIRTDGIDVNKKAAQKAVIEIYHKYYNSAKDESILISDHGVRYDLDEWIENGHCKVCIFYHKII